jgi:hypothetical protein
MALVKRVAIIAPAAVAVALVTGVGPASAAASRPANCVGQLVSAANSVSPGSGGQGAAFFAHVLGGLGGPASNDFCPI